MGVIYGGTRGTDTSLFGMRGTVPLYFSGRKCEEFAVTCCQQKRSAKIKLYNKTIFGRGESPGSRRESSCTMLSQTPESDKEWTLHSHSPSFSPPNPRVPRSPSELVLPLFRPKLRPLMSTIFNFRKLYRRGYTLDRLMMWSSIVLHNIVSYKHGSTKGSPPLLIASYFL